MRIVTAGASYADIDVYGGCTAYAELLQLQGEDAVAVYAGELTESVSRTVRSWNAPILTDYTPAKNDTFTIIDVSNPEHFNPIVDLAKVVEVIDHHRGFEDYWRERIGDNAHIEFIGAACTLVYECWQAAGMLDKMSTLSARLLVCGILDNTLNLGAKITSQRDVDAYNALLALSDLPVNWTAQYFSECEEGIMGDVVTAIRNDAKTMELKTFTKPVRAGQLAVWNCERILADYQSQIRDALSDTSPEWFMNLIHIEAGKSYFVAEDRGIRQWLETLLDIRFEGSVAIADRLWLRKEIIKRDIEAG